MRESVMQVSKCEREGKCHFMQIYLPSTNNKLQNGWDTVGYNQT